MRTTPFLLVGLVLLLQGVSAGSELTWKSAGPPEQSLIPPHEVKVGLEVLVDGSPVRVISHQGRLYLPVPKRGAEYQIRVSNDGPRRITAIVSVDGLSVIHGRPASSDDPGYVVNPGDKVVIKGWRRDRDTVATFTFEERDRSYAVRRGYPDNVGVIGLIAIEEQPVRILPLEREEKSSRPPAYQCDMGKTGTGWGRDVDSRIEYVPFVRSRNWQTVTIYYDTVENLRRMGVPIGGRKPLPFPGDPDFCQPPR